MTLSLDKPPTCQDGQLSWRHYHWTSLPHVRMVSYPGDTITGQASHMSGWSVILATLSLDKPSTCQDGQLSWRHYHWTSLPHVRMVSYPGDTITGQASHMSGWSVILATLSLDKPSTCQDGQLSWRHYHWTSLPHVRMVSYPNDIMTGQAFHMSGWSVILATLSLDKPPTFQDGQLSWRHHHWTSLPHVKMVSYPGNTITGQASHISGWSFILATSSLDKPPTCQDGQVSWRHYHWASLQHFLIHQLIKI